MYFYYTKLYGYRVIHPLEQNKAKNMYMPKLSISTRKNSNKQVDKW